MVRLDSGDIFKVIRNAQKSGLLDKVPSSNGHITPGDRFFESFQQWILENVDLDELDAVLFNLAPTIRFMADEAHWVATDFTSEEMFKAVRNLQRAGVFEVPKTKTSLPGKGSRYFEHYQALMVEKVGVEELDRYLYTLGQCIKFLASEASMENVDIETEGRACA